MDALRLLSRSTNKSSKPKSQSKRELYPSSGPNAVPLLFASIEEPPRKRRRSPSADFAPDFFTGGSARQAQSNPSRSNAKELGEEKETPDLNSTVDDSLAKGNGTPAGELSVEQRKQIYSEQKLKISWLNAIESSNESKRHSKEKQAVKTSKISIFPSPLQSFHDLARYAVPRKLVENVDKEGYTLPTEVQLAALPILLDEKNTFLPEREPSTVQGVDLLTVAPTGSGKTLAFLVPLISRVFRLKGAGHSKGRHTYAIILAPTKELVGQIVNECSKLAEGTGVKVTQTRKGMRLPRSQSGLDSDRNGLEPLPQVKSDILVSTPGLMHSMIDNDKREGSFDVLDGVQSLILDEADVLLDPLFRDQTLTVWNSLGNLKLRVELWSATIGSSIEELAQQTITNRWKKLSSTSSNTEMVHEAPFIRLVVGLKDSAIPNVKHKLIYAATEQGKLMGLRQLLHPSSSDADAIPALRPPFLVFTQTIERAVALHAELLYDIPAEAGGISRIAVLHSDLSDTARSNVMTRFRKGEIWVLITTDLLSRGIDFRGVNGVVNYDIPTTSAAYVHRVGRTGRAGRQGGVAVTFYSKEDIPYMRNIANVVSAAQKQRADAADEGDGIDQWLLDALPSLSKQDKNKLKKRGVESRTSRGRNSDPKAARKAKISTKAGFQRRVENRRKGAVQNSRKRLHEDGVELHSKAASDFEGFD